MEYIPSAPRPSRLIDSWLAKHTEITEVEVGRPSREVEVFVHLESIGIDEVEVLREAQEFGASSIMTNELTRVLTALGRDPDG